MAPFDEVIMASHQLEGHDCAAAAPEHDDLVNAAGADDGSCVVRLCRHVDDGVRIGCHAASRVPPPVVGGEGARKADKHRTEGGSHRPISAPSMWIVCHEALRAGLVERSWLLPNPVQRRLAEYRRWTNGGRKVEPTDQFWPPHWRSIGYEHCSDETVVAVISPDWGRTLAPSACRHGSH